MLYYVVQIKWIEKYFSVQFIISNLVNVFKTFFWPVLIHLPFLDNPPPYFAVFPMHFK